MGKRAERKLTSKKALLKFKEKGQKLVFDDEGNARPLYVLEGEEEFAARGVPEEQRKAFVEGERERVALGDVEDKAEAKRKRKEGMVWSLEVLSKGRTRWQTFWPMLRALLVMR